VTQFGELELLIHPSGVIPVATFLKDHHNGQFLNLSDIAGIDIPAKTNRFEVKLFYKIQHFAKYRSYFVTVAKLY